MRVIAALPILMICLANEAKAQSVVDFSTMTCQQFWDNAEADRTSLLFWLNGYFQHKNNLAALNVEKFGQQSQALALFCDREPGVNILSAADQAFTD
jgi:hypothetical protein